MENKEIINIFWFRRDLRVEDNIGLFKALNSNYPVLPIFIFEENIINSLPANDHRLNFIYDTLYWLDRRLKDVGKSILLLKGNPVDIYNELFDTYDINTVFYNHDYEPYAIKRDKVLHELFQSKNVSVESYKDQVIFEKNEITKADGLPYTIYTPYKNKWLAKFKETKIEFYSSQNLISNFLDCDYPFPTMEQLGIQKSYIEIPSLELGNMNDYHLKRDFPSLDATSKVGVHLRFGTISIRILVKEALEKNETYLSELIWREFFMQILFHFPNVVTNSFKSKYDNIEWENDEALFKKWKEGKTGYPLVDAGMRELNTTGYMHNRVRMVVASFLCKHLLIDWRWGEAYFAEKLFDYDLSANNGNWQWAAGCGCDASPYFRVFNPETQMKKFDKDLSYIKKWVPEFSKFNYPNPIVEHKSARLLAISRYKEGIS